MFKWKVSTLGRRNPSSEPGRKSGNLNNAPKAAIPLQDVVPKPASAHKQGNTATECDDNQGCDTEEGIFCYSGLMGHDCHSLPHYEIATDDAKARSMPRDLQNKTEALPQSGLAVEKLVPKPDFQIMPSTTLTAHSRENNPSVSQSWNEWTQQLQAYTAWVNSQFKKRANLPLVKDLAFDLQDGVLLFHLIDIVANKTVPGMKLEPNCPQDRRQNFESLLQFLKAQNVKLPVNLTARELVEGNLKAILRLILSIASHYKPLSVQQGREGMRSQMTPNLSALDNRKYLAHDQQDNSRVQAFATLRKPKIANKITPPQSNQTPEREVATKADEMSLKRSQSFQAKEEPLRNGRSLKRPPQVQIKTPVRSISQDRAKLTPSTPVLEKKEKLDSKKRELPSLGVSSLANKTKPAALEFWKSQTSQQTKSARRALPPLPPQPSQDASDTSETTTVDVHTSTLSSGETYSVAVQQPESSEDGMEFEAREVEGSSRQTSPCTSIVQGPTYSHRNALQWVKQSFINQSHSVMDIKSEEGKAVPYEVLLEDLHRTRKQLMDLQNLLLSSVEVERPKESRGTCTVSEEAAFAVLQSRLQNVDQRCNALQNDLHKAKQECLNLEGNRRGLAVILNEQEEALSQLRQELLTCTLHNQNLITEKAELQRKLEEKDRQIADLRRQLGVKERLKQNHKDTLDDNNRSSQRTLLERTYDYCQSANRRHQNREELQVAREALTSLRTNFRSHDPNHHTLDTLEQCIAVMLERVDMHPEDSAISRSHYESPNGYKRISNGGYQGTNGQQLTKVVYYTDRTITPFMSVITRRLGEITLRDFKLMFDRPGLYRFHFKAPDPEYGFLKEEIAEDDAILPGFDGKIIAWVEEDHNV